MSSCVKCGVALPPGALYCPMCGKKQTQGTRPKPLKRANGTGTVYKLSGRRRKPWVAAKRKVILGYYETKTEALDALSRVAGTDISDRYNLTFAQVYDGWSMEHYKGLSKQAVYNYVRAYNVFAPLYDRKYRTLRTGDFQNIVDAQTTAPGTTAKLKLLITQMSAWALREEVITTDYGKYIQLPTIEKKEKEIFTAEEIERIASDGSEASRIVVMLLATGMRIGELFALNVTDYHGAYVVGGEKTEAGKNRVIPIRPEGRESFEYFIRHADGEKLLSGYVGNKTADSYRKRDYGKLLERLQIPYKTPHATRHTYATRAVAEGMRPEILQRILGHASYSTTVETYTHLDIDTLVAAVDK